MYNFEQTPERPNVFQVPQAQPPRPSVSPYIVLRNAQGFDEMLRLDAITCVMPYEGRHDIVLVVGAQFAHTIIGDFPTVSRLIENAYCEWLEYDPYSDDVDADL